MLGTRCACTRCMRHLLHAIRLSAYAHCVLMRSPGGSVSPLGPHDRLGGFSEGKHACEFCVRFCPLLYRRCGSVRDTMLSFVLAFVTALTSSTFGPAAPSSFGSGVVGYGFTPYGSIPTDGSWLSGRTAGRQHGSRCRPRHAASCLIFGPFFGPQKKVPKMSPRNSGQPGKG